MIDPLTSILTAIARGTNTIKYIGIMIGRLESTHVGVAVGTNTVCYIAITADRSSSM
jgi:hypothetical protein